jgi:hypothetical protein
MTDPVDLKHTQFTIEEAKALTRHQRSYRRMLGFMVPNLPHGWTWERECELMRLVADRLTGSQIANRMGLTRSTIMGKAARMGMTIGGGRERPAETREMRREARRNAARDRQRKRRGTPEPALKPDWRSSVAVLGAAEAWVALPFTVPVRLVDLGKDSCRWPIDGGTTMFCGTKAVAGKPYCPIHHRASLNPYYRRVAS